MEHRHDARHILPVRFIGLQRLLSFVAAAAILVAILACMTTPRVTVKSAPANQLQISLTFFYGKIHGLNPQLRQDEVIIAARVEMVKAPNIAFGGGQRFTCNGANMLRGDQRIKRQPPGGQYTCVYTDEKGTQTTLVIPVPAGQFMVIDPSSDAKVAIPSIVTAIPPGAPITPQSTQGVTDTGQLPHQPLAITYTMPAIPTGALATVSAWGSCAKPDCAILGRTLSPAPTSGVYVFDDAVSTGTSDFGPGAGDLEFSLRMGWSPEPQGFNRVAVEVDDTIAIPVTWVAASGT